MKYYSDKVYSIENLRQAYKTVKASNGDSGVDGQTVWLNPVRRVEISKPDGSKRPLGVPTV